MSIIGKEVKKIRIRKGVTVSQLADMVGCTPKYIYALESGEIEYPRVDRLADICNCLNASLPNFFKRIDVANR